MSYNKEDARKELEETSYIAYDNATYPVLISTGISNRAYLTTLLLPAATCGKRWVILEDGVTVAQESI